MTYTELVARLKSLVILDEVGSDNPMGRDAATAIETLERERDAAQHIEATALKLLKANTLTLEIVATERDALRAEVAKLRTPTHRHKKRGTEYVLIGFGKMQAEWWHDAGSSWPDAKVDMREVAIYRDASGDWWVRPREEFEDGRFEVL